MGACCNHVAHQERFWGRPGALLVPPRCHVSSCASRLPPDASLCLQMALFGLQMAPKCLPVPLIWRGKKDGSGGTRGNFYFFLMLVTAFITRYRQTGNKVQRQATKDEEGSTIITTGSTFQAWSASCRRHLLPQSLIGILPFMTRLQALLVLLLVVYSILFSFIGIAYKEWVNSTKPPGRRIEFNSS